MDSTPTTSQPQTPEESPVSGKAAFGNKDNEGKGLFMQKYLISALGFMAVTATVLSLWLLATQPKIGFIDAQKLVAESEIGKEGATALKAMVEQKNRFVDEKRQELIAISGDKDREALAEQKKVELARIVQQARVEIQSKDRELTQKILPEAAKIAKEIGEKKGYTMIIDVNSGSVVYARAKGQLTAQVVKVLNERLKGKEAAE